MREKEKLRPLFTWRSAIAQSDLPSTVRHVALTLSLHMSDVGDSCFPSRQTLARETGLAVRTVQRALKALEEAGYLEVERPAKEKGRGHSNKYMATVPEGRQCGSLPHGRETLTTQKGVTESPESVIEEDSTNGSDVEITVVGTPTGALSRARKRDLIWELLYTLETGALYDPSDVRLTPAARSKLNAAARDIRSTGISPEDLSRAIAAWPTVFPGATATAHAVAAHLPRLLAAADGLVARRSEVQQTADEAERLLQEWGMEREVEVGW